MQLHFAHHMVCFQMRILVCKRPAVGCVPMSALAETFHNYGDESAHKRKWHKEWPFCVRSSFALAWRGVALLAIPMHMASPFNPSSLHRIADVLRMGTCTHFRVQHFHSPVRFFSALSRPLYFAFILMLTSMRSSHVIGRILRCNAVPCTIWWQKTTQQQQQRQYADEKKKDPNKLC